MTNFVAFVMVTVLLPAVLSLELGINLNLTLPPLELGSAVDNLIDVQVALNILSIPYDPSLGIAGCSVNGHTTARNGLSTGGNLWPKAADGTPYMAVVIDPAFSQSERDTIWAGMLAIQNKSCFRFYLYNESGMEGYDYVFIQRKDDGCWSPIGRQGGKQLINLAPQTCSTCGHCMWPGTIAHELLHAIGFDHMQNTPGRDQYVAIQWTNIEPKQLHAFYEDNSSAYTNYTALGVPYDYDSVMHYEKAAFSVNGQDTIVVLNGAAIGQRNVLTHWDAVKVNHMYGCLV